VLCDETKEHTVNILIPNERVITLVFWFDENYKKVDVIVSNMSEFHIFTFHKVVYLHR